MDYIALIGNVAAAFTTISFLPQAIKTIRTKDTAGLSFPMYFMFVFGVTLWLIYGLLNNQMPIIIGNLITLILAGIIFCYLIKNEIRKRKIQAKKVRFSR